MGAKSSLREMIFRRKTDEGSEEPTKQKTQMQMLTSASNMQSQIWSELHYSDLVHSALRPYAKHVGKLVPKHIQGENMMPDPNLRQLLKTPNPMMSMQMLLEKVVMSVKIDGNAYIYTQYEGHRLTGLYPLQPNNVTALKDATGEIYLRFDFSGDGKSQVIPYRHIIHIRNDFYEHDLFADSPALALQELMETISITESGMRHAVKSSAVVRWIVKFTNAMRNEDLKAKTREIENDFLSLESNFGGVAGVDGKFDLKQVKNENQLYIPDNNVQKILIQRVYNFFGVNEKIISNTFTEEEFEAWYAAEIEPIAKQLSDAFTKVLFSMRERAHGNKIEFDSGALVFASNKTKLGLVQLLDRGVLSVEAYQRILNLEPMDGETFLIRREYAEMSEIVGEEAKERRAQEREAQQATSVGIERSGGEENAER